MAHVVVTSKISKLVVALGQDGGATVCLISLALSSNEWWSIEARVHRLPFPSREMNSGFSSPGVRGFPVSQSIHFKIETV